MNASAPEQMGLGDLGQLPVKSQQRNSFVARGGSREGGDDSSRTQVIHVHQGGAVKDTQAASWSCHFSPCISLLPQTLKDMKC